MEEIIKNKCAVCEKRIPETRNHYETYGNYCFRCANRATNLAVAKSTIKFLSGKLGKAEEEGEKVIVFKGTIKTIGKPIIRSVEEVEEMIEREEMELRELILSAPQYYSGKLLQQYV